METSEIFMQRREILAMFEEAWWPVWILFVREKVAVESTPITARLAAQPVNQAKNSIGHHRILLEYQVQGCQLPLTQDEGNTRRTEFSVTTLQPLPHSYFVTSSSFLFSGNLFARRWSDFPNEISVRKYTTRSSWGLARDWEAVVRKNQANHGDPFHRRDARSNRDSLKRADSLNYKLVVER